MATTDCEAVILAAMALMDGEQPASTAAEVDAHVSACETCASELEQLRSSRAILARVHRAPVTADLWPTIAPRLADTSSARTNVAIAAVLIALILWRTFELAAIDPLALWSRLFAVAVGIALFVFFRANPFRLEPRLI